ncbi:MAG: retropepsin-like aspartic protease family protein [Gammaproteobacteria bacterium]
MKSILIAASLMVLAHASSAIAAQSAAVSIRAVGLFKNKAVLDIDGKRRTIKVGDETREGVKLINANSEKAVISLQGETITLKLNGKITTGHDKQKNLVQLYPGEGGHYFVDGLINGHSIPFLVDTGATTIAINKNMARKIGLQYRVDGTAGRVETASGVVPAYNVSFDKVQIRSITLKNVRGTVIESAYPSIALLGQSFLNRLNLRREGIMMELSER